jgi:hypothetical protein
MTEDPHDSAMSQKFFQVSGKILSATQKTRLARQYRKDFARMYKALAAA